MKIIIFDVSNGSCALAVCPNGNSLMYDCGSHEDKICPVQKIKSLRGAGLWLSHMKDYRTRDGVTYPLTNLVISHPDLDHIKNIEKVHKDLTPYLLCRQYIEDFPSNVVEQDDESFKYYKNNVCANYRGNNPELPDWGFERKSFSIPMNTLKNDAAFGEEKMKNNSSIVYLLEYPNTNAPFRVLFGGDMETIGWDWLIDKNHDGFKDELSKGVDILIPAHHGHVSGYSQKLIDIMGTPSLSVLSKGSETGGDTDVDSRYSTISTGLTVRKLSDSTEEIKYTVTTRSNGNIYIHVDTNGRPRILTDK